MEIRRSYPVVWPERKPRRVLRKLRKPVEAVPQPVAQLKPIKAPKKAKAARKEARAKAKAMPKAPRAKKIAKKPAERETRIERNERKRAENAKLREEKLKGHLLDQLRLLDQRINTMERDKERYCLISLTDEKKGLTFTLMKDQDPKQLHIRVDGKNRVTCSCMDWRTRCRTMAIACKHVYYVLTKILTYELFDYYDNTIQDPARFQALVKQRIRLNHVEYQVKNNDNFEGEACPVCFNAYQREEAERLLKCPQCRHFVHRDCMRIWLQHSPRRNCVICRSESWATYFPQLHQA